MKKAVIFIILICMLLIISACNNQTVQESPIIMNTITEDEIKLTESVIESATEASESAEQESKDSPSTPAKDSKPLISSTETSTATPKPTQAKKEEAFNGIVINKNEITNKAKFIPYSIDGVVMEVFAVKASDGVIRTAFNTCQICYDSGLGYYVQQGDVFICQNCNNRFKTLDIEKIKGGCNPIPITADLKTEDAINIKISNSTLSDAKEYFLGWKR